MRLRILGSGLAIGAAIAATVLAGPTANASQGGGGNGGGGRPCGTATVTSGVGTQGSTFTLKSMYDDDGAVPGVVVGEEFEINTEAVGQHWTVQLADNGVIFLNQNDISDVTGIKGMSMTPAQPGSQVMTAHAVNTDDGEMVDGTVTLAPPSARCGH
ncbi:MAG TPA: hypothetical protein VFW65_24920 [Pseudonocardiaceae bacterium]|nr:hypothetical protein [Pseudonocardiaceae bacterium]